MTTDPQLCPQCLGQRGHGNIVDGWEPCSHCHGTGYITDFQLDMAGNIIPLSGVAELIDQINQRLSKYCAIPEFLLKAPKRCLIIEDSDGSWRSNYFSHSMWSSMGSTERSRFIRAADDKSLLALLDFTLERLAKLLVENHPTPPLSKYITAERKNLQLDLRMIHRELVLRMPTYFTPTSTYIVVDNKRYKFSDVSAIVLEDQLIKLEKLIIAAETFGDPLDKLFPDQRPLRLSLWFKKQRRIIKELEARTPCTHQHPPESQWKLVYRPLDFEQEPNGDFTTDQPTNIKMGTFCTRCGGRL